VRAIEIPADLSRCALQGGQPVARAIEIPADFSEGEGQPGKAFVVEIDRPGDVDPVREGVVSDGAEVFRLATEVDQVLEVVTTLEHYPTDDRETVTARDRVEGHFNSVPT
jgi:hypothetical protein